jgi:hypothetical protein
MARRKKVIQQRGPLGSLQSAYEEETEEEDGIIADGGSLRVPMWAMDSVQKAVATLAAATKLLVTDGTDNALNLHKPGFRFSTNPAERAAADAALEQAYLEVEARDSEAWRSSFDEHPLNMQNRGLSPGKREGDACSIDGRRGRLQMVNGQLECIADKQHDAQSVADCYEQYDREAESAWKT